MIEYIKKNNRYFSEDTGLFFNYFFFLELNFLHYFIAIGGKYV